MEEKEDIFSCILSNDVFSLRMIYQKSCNDPKRMETIFGSSNDLGYSPLCYSIVENKKECFDVLMDLFQINVNHPREWYNVSTALIESIYGYYEEKDKATYMYYFHKLLEKGSDPNAPDNYGNAPLHYAMKLGLEEMTRTLIQYGADPLQENYLRKTGMDVAFGNMKDIAQKAMEEYNYLYQPKEPSP